MSSADSAVFLDSSPPKTKTYMDSLVPPSPDQFEQIAHAQEEKEEEARRLAKEQHLQRRSPSPSSRSHSSSQEGQRAKAAAVIQKTFRGYRTRRELDGHSLNASTRWVAAMREAQFRQSTKPRGAGSTEEVLALEDPVDYRPSTTRRKWKLASVVARRAGHDDTDSESELSESEHDGMTPEQIAAAKQRRLKATMQRRNAARMLAMHYFLEMVDSKHRYGSNLRMYHEEWKKSDTTQNFFYWLDYGEGRDLELDTCPRDRLEREQVRYLSREERQYYLVRVDDEGRLCWAKNGARIDTTEDFRDSIHGVVPIDDPTPAYKHPDIPNGRSHYTQHPSGGEDSSCKSDSSAESRREADRAAKYQDPDDRFSSSKGFKKVTHVSASTIFNQLLRKSVKQNTWIFVADTSFRLYVGIKDSGAFQHSSFLQGSRISAAGLIKIKNGRLSSLSPLSGHYRPPASNFRAFIKNLKEEGVDTSHVSISKAYTILVGLEVYLKTRKKGKELMGKLIHGRDKIVAPDEVRKRKEEAKDKSKSAEQERKVLRMEKEEEKRLKGEQPPTERVADKLRSIPAHLKAGS